MPSPTTGPTPTGTTTGGATTAGTTTAGTATSGTTTAGATTTGTTTAGATTAQAAPAPSVKTLDFADGIWLAVAVIVGMLAAGGVVLRARKELKDASGQSGSVIRSWIAISLVMGLVVFCAAAFLIDDSSLRSTLFGGLVTAVGAAVAFYFSAQAADQARTDVLSALGQGGTAPAAFSHATPPDGPSGTPYSYQFVAGGQPSPTYGVTSGHLPDGLSLSPDGTLHGTPTTVGAYTFVVVATNSAGSLHTANLTMNVA